MLEPRVDVVVCRWLGWVVAAGGRGENVRISFSVLSDGSDFLIAVRVSPSFQTDPSFSVLSGGPIRKLKFVRVRRS